MTKVNLYGLAAVDAVTYDQAVTSISRVIDEGCRAKVLTLNTTGLMMADRDPFFRTYTSGAQLVVADGQPLVWASPLFGTRLPERVAGIDLIDRISARAAADGHSIFLLGAETDTVALAANVLERRHPGLKIAGYHHGFLGDDAAGVASQITAAGADILFVGMGSPRQEQFIDEHWDQLGVPIAMGVGGSFEVLADKVKRAPKWAQRTGLEWVFRMAQEPGRLAMRYLDTAWWLTRKTVPVLLRQPRPSRRLSAARPQH